MSKIVYFFIIVFVIAGVLFFMTQENKETYVKEDTSTQEVVEENNIREGISENTHVILKTNKGDITLKLYGERAPITAGNFYTLAKEGFYNGTKIHRVIDGFIIQGGDPNSRGDNTSLYGQGGPGYVIEDEFVEGLSNTKGTIAMANSGPNSGGSQFFINLSNNVGLDFNKQPLSSKHPVFGEVVEGMDVVRAIAEVETDARDIPRTAIIVEDVIIK